MEAIAVIGTLLLLVLLLASAAAYLSLPPSPTTGTPNRKPQPKTAAAPAMKPGADQTFSVSNGQVYPVTAVGLTVGAEYDVYIHAKPLPGFLDGNVRATVREGGREVLPVTTIRTVAGTAMFVQVGPGVFRASRDTHVVDVHVTGHSPAPDDDAPTMKLRVRVAATEY